MTSEKKITADLILDLYEQSKKAKGLKQAEIMKKVIYLSQHLNEKIKAEKLLVK